MDCGNSYASWREKGTFGLNHILRSTIRMVIWGHSNKATESSNLKSSSGLSNWFFLQKYFEDDDKSPIIALRLVSLKYLDRMAYLEAIPVPSCQIFLWWQNQIQPEVFIWKKEKLDKISVVLRGSDLSVDCVCPESDWPFFGWVRFPLGINPGGMHLLRLCLFPSKSMPSYSLAVIQFLG